MSETAMSPRLPCPRCRAPSLFAGRSGELELHACERCWGVWLDPRAGTQVLRPLARELAAAANHGGEVLGCPVCRQGMQTLATGRAGVVVDRCVKHGVWFDRDELGHIMAAIATMQGRAPASLPPVVPREPSNQISNQPGGSGLGSKAAWGAGAAAVGAGVAAVAMADYGGDGCKNDANRAFEHFDPAMAADGAVASAEIGDALVDTASEAAPDVARAAGDAAEGAAESAGGILDAIADFFTSW